MIPIDVIERIDMDRIQEEEENFLETDRRKPLALDEDKLKPLVRGVSTIVLEDTSK